MGGPARPPTPPDGTAAECVLAAKTQTMSRVDLLRRVLRPTPTLGHELVEFGFIPSLPQPVQERLELLLLLLKTPHGFVAILVKRTIAA